MSNKKIRVFAGPNGSGKSSLFQEFSKSYNTGPFINADEIESTLISKGLIDLKDLGLKATQEELDAFFGLPFSQSLLQKAAQEGLPVNILLSEDCIVARSRNSHSYEASFTAAFIRHLLIREGKSFSFETVMSHRSKIEEVKSLVGNGYRAYLYFVCTDDPIVNISRVANRVEKGGHDVSQSKVMERYSRTLGLLHEVLPVCYRAYLFDNSGKRQVLIAEQYNGALELKTDTPPKWFIDYVLPYYTN